MFTNLQVINDAGKDDFCATYTVYGVKPVVWFRHNLDGGNFIGCENSSRRACIYQHVFQGQYVARVAN